MKALFLNRIKTDQIGNQSTIKQLMLILALSVFAISAQARGSELQISLWNNQDFEIQIDQKRFYADCDFIATDLRPGKHRIRITQRQENCYGNGGSGRVLFNGFVNVPRNSKVIAKVRPNRRIRVLDTIRLRPYGQYGGGTYGSNGGFGQTSIQPIGYTSGGGCGNGYEGNFLSTYEIDMLIDDLENAWFDSDRVNMVKQRLRHKKLSSYHVKRILLTINFECNRVELAKFAFDRVNDPNNFFLINDVFDFQSSVNEVHDYIHG